MHADTILRETNAEIRREIVRKIGIEKVCKDLNAQPISHYRDEVNGMNYELLLLDLGDGRTRPYLKMRNPSIGVYHIEGVPPEITSAEQALIWRNYQDGPKYIPPLKLT